MSKRIITLGTWDGKPIEWLVLKEEGFASLVVSKYNLFIISFSNSSNEWYNSDIRKYLNSTFFNKAFSESEKRKIFNVKLNDVNTKDNIFIPNIDEARLINNLSEISANRWWLRTKRECNTLWGVDTDGAIDRNLNYRNNEWVHVSMWIKEK